MIENTIDSINESPKRPQMLAMKEELPLMTWMIFRKIV